MKARSSSLARDQMLPFPREVRNAMRRHIVLNALILLPILGCGAAQESAVKTVERGSVIAPGAAGTPAAPAFADGSVRASGSPGMMGGMVGAMGTALSSPDQYRCAVTEDHL